MSDLDYDAKLTDSERERLDVIVHFRPYPSDGARIAALWAAVERILQARLLDLAQRAEADRAAVERVRALADEAQPAISHGPADCKNTCWDGACTCSGIPRPLGWTLDPEAIRAALDPKEDQ